MDHGVAHLSANLHDFPDPGGMIRGAGIHQVLNALLFVHVLHLVQQDAHGVAKHVVHIGFQLHAPHVLHARRVFPNAGLHCRVGGIRVRRVVGNAVHRQIGFHGGYHGFRQVRPDFHELVGFGHDPDEVRIVHHVDARQARDFPLGFFAHERQKRQRVLVRAPDAGVVHHREFKLQVR